ncbi:MAG TPA: hypothetical protein VIV61_06485 [Candidatus Ozemobacteraceae bacterium]
MRMMRGRYPGRGVTLIEIMLALFIMASAMLPIASLMGYGGRATLKDNRHIVGIQLLQQTATLLLQAPYRDIPTGTDLAVYATPPIALGNVTGPNGAVYRVLLTSELVPVSFSYYSVNVQNAGFSEAAPRPTDFVGPNTLNLANCLKRLTIRVSWQEQGTVRPEITCVTYRADLNRRGSAS